jgi:hypothetical protein
MDSCVHPLANFWFAGRLHVIERASFINEATEVKVSPFDKDLERRIADDLRDPRKLHTISVTWSGSYRYFPEDAEAFEKWRLTNADNANAAKTEKR